MYIFASVSQIEILLLGSFWHFTNDFYPQFIQPTDVKPIDMGGWLYNSLGFYLILLNNYCTGEKVYLG